MSPASIPRSRNDLSQSSPNAVSPIPMTATSRLAKPPASLGRPSHQDLPAILRVRRVVERDRVLHHVVHRPPAALETLDLIRDSEVEPVAPRTAAVPDREDPVPGLRHVEDRAHPDHDRPAVRVPDVPHEEARVDLLLREPDLLPDAERELPVRLMEHREV